jgi:hypothetical protein
LKKGPRWRPLRSQIPASMLHFLWHHDSRHKRFRRLHIIQKVEVKGREISFLPAQRPPTDRPHRRTPSDFRTEGSGLKPFVWAQSGMLCQIACSTPRSTLPDRITIHVKFSPTPSGQLERTMLRSHTKSPLRNRSCDAGCRSCGCTTEHNPHISQTYCGFHRRSCGRSSQSACNRNARALLVTTFCFFLFLDINHVC